MNQKYNDCIEQISQILFQAITEREENLVETVERVDSDLLSLLRSIGLRVMSMLMTWLVNQVTSQTQTIGWVIHRRRDFSRHLYKLHFQGSNPIFEVAQTSIIKMSARIQPFKHHCLLVGSWINSISVVHGKHPIILA